MQNVPFADNLFQTYDSESPVATELRRVYHNIKNGDGGKKPKTFMITSSNRGEGKSTVTCNLALTIAQFPKKKVLLIDADLRRPRVHKIFGIENDIGLMECLEGVADPIAVCQKTQLSNLDIITAGGRSPEPGKLFEAETLAEVINKASFYNDVVIVDSAPVLAVSDTLFLCSVIDSVLLLILAGVTPREVALRSRNVLADSGANLGGIILNNASQVLPYHYDAKYYQYSGR